MVRLAYIIVILVNDWARGAKATDIKFLSYALWGRKHKEKSALFLKQWDALAKQQHMTRGIS